MPGPVGSLWDSLKATGTQVASTAGGAAGGIFQSTLGSFKGVATDKINEVTNGVQTQVGSIVKKADSKSPASAPITAITAPTPKQQAGISIGVLIVLGVVVFLFLRRNK